MSKNQLITLLLFVIASIGFGQTHLYENPKFDEITKDHKIIAIIPFKTSITLRPKEMKETTPEQLAKMEKSEGESIQAAMYSWFLKREKEGSFFIQVQDPSTTNALLKRQNISYDNIPDQTPAELAKILGVDAVILGTFETNKPMSEGASVALGLLVGFWGSTNKAVMNLYIHNGADGQLLVNYNKAVSGSIGSTTEDLINRLMRKASRRVSYTR
jgi:hypothetical protein